MVHDHFLSINYENLKRIQKLFFTQSSCLFSRVSDSEMRGVYLKSVRSPVVCGRFKMSYRNRHMDVFSQVGTGVFFFSSQASNSNNLSSKHRCLRWTKRTPRIVLW